MSESTLKLYLADYIKNVVYTGNDGDNGLYYHDGVGSYTNADQEAGDNSYRYAGANPNNYVCFASDVETCPTDNLYRIIGVFGDLVKLIKSTSLGNYYWNDSRSNTWSDSTLNTGTLNGTYLNGLGTTWSDMIETTTWKVGGITSSERSNPPKTVYGYEITNNSIGTTYNAKIGLMYISDYGYTGSPANWTTILDFGGYNDSTNTSNNWIYLGLDELTITRNSDTADQVFFLDATGYVFNNRVIDYYLNVRTTFYLKSNVAITSGDGSSSNPYRLTLG